MSSKFAKIRKNTKIKTPFFLLHCNERNGVFMLGTSAGLKQRKITDFKEPTDYINYLFNGIRGWICKGKIDKGYSQCMFRFNGLMQENFAGENNTYISMNTFFKNERTVDCLKRLNTLYVDIDCYKLAQDKRRVFAELKESYFDSIIPIPTFVIDSGRGLYLVWKLRNEDRNALPRWTKVQEYLIDALKGFGADSACRDAARILRVPFTRNSKSGTYVKVLEFNDVTYNISEIQQEYGIAEKKAYKRSDGEKTHPYNTATEPMRRYAIQLATKLGKNLPDFDNFLETKKWISKMKLTITEKKRCDCKTTTKMRQILQGYCKDLEILFSLRSGENCKREIALFLYRLFCYEMTGNKKIALEHTLAFNASLSCPFPESYVIRATKSAEKKIDKGDTYHYKRETIMDVLEITKEEMKHLIYFVGKEQRQERKKNNNRETYLKHLTENGKITKAESREKRRSAIIAMQKKGKSAQEIMCELSISKATYYREVAEIAAKRDEEKGKDALQESTEKAMNIAENAAEDITVVKKQIENKVSKIQPYHYESKALPCRTGFSGFRIGDLDDSSGGTGG